MLDLNHNVVSSDSASNPVDVPAENVVILSGSPMDSSGSFNSSIVNADTSTNTFDEDSCSYGDAFANDFGTVKNNNVNDATSDKAVDLLVGEGEDVCDLTIQLFPNTGAEEGRVTELRFGQRFPGSTSSKGWLDFLCQEVGPGGTPKQRMLPPAAPESAGQEESAGTESRSSQYSGVTFIVELEDGNRIYDQ